MVMAQLHRGGGGDKRGGSGGKRCIAMKRSRSWTAREGAPTPFGGCWRFARSPISRLRGLAGRQPDNTVLVFPRCRDVHTLTMGYPLDVLFVDDEGRVIEVYRSVPPKSRLHCPRASAVVERFARFEPWFNVGDRLMIDA